MTLNLALSLLRQGRNGDQILSILDSIANDEAEANIADAAAHFATLQEIQF